MSLVLADKTEKFDREELFERAASHYLEMLDSEGKAPKLNRVVEAVCAAHPCYDSEQVALYLRSSDFNDYLLGRRRRHLIERTAARLVAAEMGSRLGVDALEALRQRLVFDPDSIKTSELIAIAKLGMDLNAGVDKDLTEATGDVKIAVHLKDVLIGLPPERAAALMAEYGRAMASPRAKGEIIDASGSYTEE